MTAPDVSVVIPVYQEAPMLARAVKGAVANLERRGLRWELILAENGSTDGTAAIARRLAAGDRRVRLLSLPTPNYGAALRAGIEAARGAIILCDEIDLLDDAFHERAIGLLTEDPAVDVVVGSKLLSGARDHRPLHRNVASRVYNGLLRVAVGYTGTDTHGLKALRRATVLPVVRRCRIDQDVFASELVIRAQRDGLTIREVPVSVREQRPPSIRLFRRIPSVLARVVRLRRALRQR